MLNNPLEASMRIFGYTLPGAVFALANPAQAAGGYTLLHTFAGAPTDGGKVGPGLLKDAAGNFYGATYEGGATNGGTIFKLTPGSTETVLYSFCPEGFPNCSDGFSPDSGLLRDKEGNLYGVTTGRGEAIQSIVFRLAPNGTLTTLYTFCRQTNCIDGLDPVGGVVADKSGNLYGATYQGGAKNNGTVFKLAPDGTETVLYSFCSQTDCADGFHPNSQLVADKAGNLYGTAAGGAHGDYSGAVFRLAPDGTETVLHTFCTKRHCHDGRLPEAGLLMDDAGNLYGTTYYGGAQDRGTVFEIPAGGKFSLLYSFCTVTDCSDGSDPASRLTIDKVGNLYGTTAGSSVGDEGTVFRLAQDRSETILHTFEERNDLQLPGSLLLDHGHFYGTAYEGGNSDNCSAGCGGIFKLRN